MKRLLLSSVLFTLLVSTLPFTKCRADEIFTYGRWKVTYVSEKGTVKVNHADSEGAYRPVIISSIPEAHYDNAAGSSRSVQASDFAEVKTTETSTDDAFGPGTCFDIIWYF